MGIPRSTLSHFERREELGNTGRLLFAFSPKSHQLVGVLTDHVRSQFVHPGLVLRNEFYARMARESYSPLGCQCGLVVLEEFVSVVIEHVLHTWMVIGRIIC